MEYTELRKYTPAKVIRGLWVEVFCYFVAMFTLSYVFCHSFCCISYCSSCYFSLFLQTYSKQIDLDWNGMKIRSLLKVIVHFTYTLSHIPTECSSSFDCLHKCQTHYVLKTIFFLKSFQLLLCQRTRWHVEMKNARISLSTEAPTYLCPLLSNQVGDHSWGGGGRLAANHW